MPHANAKRKKGRYFVIGSIFVVIAVAAAVLIFVQARNRARVVGDNLAVETITEFCEKLVMEHEE